MIKYRLRRYFEYVTVKTPILSLVLAFVTFFIVFGIAGSIKVDQYYRSEAYILGNEDDGIMIYTRLDKEIEYDENVMYAYLYPGDESKGIRCSFLFREEEGDLWILYFKPVGDVPGLDLSGDLRIDIVQRRITLARRIMGDYAD